MRKLASSATAETGDLSQPSLAALASDRIRLAEHAPTGKFSEHTSRSLVADVEARAQYFGVSVQTTPLRLDGAVVATAYTFERPLFGFATGIHDGVVVLSAMWEPHLTPWLSHRLHDFVPFDLATFSAAGPGAAGFSPDRLAIRNRSLTGTIQASDVQEVMPFDDRFDYFLERLDLSTRRNVSRALQHAAETDIEFSFTDRKPRSPPSSLRKLAAKNTPRRRPYRRTASLERFAAAQSHPYQASLTHRDGRLVSLAGGFIEGDLALMAYQLNHRDHRTANTSLMLVAFLVQRLMSEGVRSIAFMGGCAGSFQHYCERVPGAELVLVRNTLSARIKQRACTLTRPRSRIARLSESLSDAASS